MKADGDLGQSSRLDRTREKTLLRMVGEIQLLLQSYTARMNQRH